METETKPNYFGVVWLPSSNFWNKMFKINILIILTRIFFQSIQLVLHLLHISMCVYIK